MLEKLFGFDPKVHSVKTELLAGISTFLTMAYILAVNPNILAETGMSKEALFTSTAIVSAFATLLMAVYAKLPFALAPGMGLNVFFAITICLSLGYSWQFALTAVFIEGIIFILLTITNLREKIVYSLPLSLKYAVSTGIGLLLAFIGMQNAGLVISQPATIIALGDLSSGGPLVCLIGLLITACLLVKQVRGALLIGILAATAIGIPLGVTNFNGFISTPPSLSPIFLQFEWSNILTKDMFTVVFTLLFVDMFDTIGTLVGVSMKAGMVDKNGNIPHLKQAFLVDAIGTTTGAMCGSSTVTTFVESAAGVSEGGRTGLTAFATAVCFALALFLSPLFLSIPGAATAPVLILVGLMMMSQIHKVDFRDYAEAIPAFLCILIMPFSHSIAEGIVFGLISYVLINTLTARFHKITISMVILAAIFASKYFM